MKETSLKDQFDALPGGIVVTDTHSKVLYTNLATAKRTGFDVAEIIGKKPGELWGGRMEKGFYRKMWQTLRHDKTPFVGTVQNKKKNHTPYAEDLFLLPVLNEEKQPEYYIHMHPDIEDPVKKEEFKYDFFRRTQSGNFENDMLPWMTEVLRKDKEGNKAPLTFSTSPEQNSGLASVVYQFLIEPIEKLFSRRNEDALLIEKAKTDPKQFAFLYEKYYSSVKEYFLKRLENNKDLSEDLTQEVFIRAFYHIQEFRILNASYLTYLIRIAHNVLVNYYRRTTLNERLHVHHDVIYHPPELVEETFEDILKPLSLPEKNIMSMKYKEGMKISEIATRVGKTENAVKLSLSRSRKKLKKAI